MKPMPMPKRSMCPGTACPGCSSSMCEALGGKVGEPPHKAMMAESGYEKGINRGRNLESGTSYAGAHARGQVFKGQSKEENLTDSKNQHSKTLGEMKAMPKPKLYEHGGEVDPDEMGDMDRQESMLMGFLKDKKLPEQESKAIEMGEDDYAEGGSVDDDSEMMDAVAGELMNALESKNKKEILDAIRAIVLSCK